MKHLLLSVLCLAALLASVDAIPNVLNATYQTHKDTLLGVELDRTRIKVNFDRDLYWAESISCNAHCAVLPECMPCDYRASSCGQTWSPSTDAELALAGQLPSSCGCGEQDENRDALCQGAAESTTLVEGAGETEVRVIKKSELHLYRLYWADTCKGFIVKYRSHGGNVKFAISRTPNLADAFFTSSLIELLEDADQVRLCPAEASFGVGNYYLFALPQEDSRYSLELVAVESVEPRPPVIDQATMCPTAPLGLPCIEDGVPSTVSGIGFALRPFSFFAFQCTQVEVWIELKQGAPPGFNAEARVHIDDGGTFETIPLVVTAGQNRVINVCPQLLPDGTPVPGFVVAFALFVVTAPVPWEFDITMRSTAPESVVLHPVAELTQPRAWKLGGTVQMLCPVIDIPAPEGKANELRCQPGQRCTRLWPTVSTEAEFDHGLYPVPLELKALDASFSGISLPPVATASRTVASQLTLNTINSIAASGPPTVLLSHENALNCLLIVSALSTLVDANNEPVQPQVISFAANREAPLCDAASFQHVVDVSDELAASLVSDGAGEPLSAVALQTSRYHVDAIAYGTAWQSCVSLTRSFYRNTTVENVGVVTDQCLAAFDDERGASVVPNDECCNSELKWLGCCEPRLTEVATPAGGAVDRAAIAAQCQAAGDESAGESDVSTECIGELVQEFADRQATLDIGVCAAIIPGQLTNLLYERTAFYRQCRLAAFGNDDLNGVRCLSDLDCADFGGLCDASIGRCVNGRALMEDRFVECLVDSMPPFARFTLAGQLGVTGGGVDAAALRDALRQHGATQACVSETGPGSKSRAHFNSASRGNFCGPCDTFCLDTTCKRPLYCTDRGPCGKRDWTSVIAAEARTQEQCEAVEQVCNWDSSLDTDDCLAGRTHACMVCTTPSRCAVIEGFTGTTEAECRAANLCMRPDGSVRAIGVDEGPEVCATESQCLSGVTRTSVPGVADAEQCAALGGECDQIDSIAEVLIDAGFRFGPAWPFPPTFMLSGVCIVPLEPEGTPTCPEARGNPLGSVDFSTRRGCIVYIKCVIVGSTPVCTKELETPELCEAEGGTWYLPLQESRAQCEGQPLCDQDDPVGYVAPKSDAACANCGGTPTRAGKWADGTLKLGFVVRGGAQWARKRVVSRLQWADTLDFARLQQLFEDIVAQQLAFDYRNELQCDKTVTKQLVSVVARQCATVGAAPALSDGESGASVGDADVSLGSGFPCAGEPSTMSTPPLRIDFSPSSISDGCVLIEATLSYATELQTTREESKTALFIDTSQEPRLYYAVRNDDDELVGQVLGDGVELSTASSDDAERVELFQRVCMTLNRRIDVDPDFGSFDLGRLTSKQTVRPLGLSSAQIELTNAGNTLCTLVPLRNQLGGGGGSITYFPVARRADYDEYSGEDELNGSEEALFYVVASIYVATALLTVAVLVAGIVMSSSLGNFFKNGLLLTLFFLLCLLRAVYFYLAGAEVLGVDENAADYVLLELPTFLYLAACSMLMLTFIFVVLSKGGERSIASRNYWISFTLIALALTIIFIVVIVLLETLPGSDSVSTSCFGRIVTVDQDDTASVIRISYKAVLTAIAIAIAAVISVFGCIISAKLDARSPLVVALTVALGVAANGIAFIVYLAVDEPTPYFAIVVMITEIVPIAVVSFLIIPRSVRERILSSASGGSLGSRKGSSGSGGSIL
jgi:hypothetical protein